MTLKFKSKKSKFTTLDSLVSQWFWRLGPRAEMMIGEMKLRYVIDFENLRNSKHQSKDWDLRAKLGWEVMEVYCKKIHNINQRWFWWIDLNSRVCVLPNLMGFTLSTWISTSSSSSNLRSWWLSKLCFSLRLLGLQYLSSSSVLVYGYLHPSYHHSLTFELGLDNSTVNLKLFSS